MKKPYFKIKLKENLELEDIVRRIEGDVKFTLVALLALIVLCTIFKFVLKISISYVPVVLLLSAWSLVAFVFQRIFKSIPKDKVERRFYFFYFWYAFLQIILAVLLVHFVGGIEWLGFLFLIFLLLFAVFILPPALSFIITTVAAVSFATLAFLEFFSILPHHSFFQNLSSSAFQDPAFFVVTLAIIVAVFYFINYSSRIFAELLFVKSKELKSSKRLYEELKISTEKFKNLKEFNEEALAQVPVGICLIDKNGAITFLNNMARQIMGLSDPKKMIGQNALAFISVQKKGLEKYFRAVIDKGESFSVDRLPYTSDTTGKKMILRLRGNPIKVSGKPENVLLMMEDLTSEDSLRQQLKEHTKELEEKVEDRTVQLKQKITEMEENRLAILNVLEDLKTVYEKLKDLDEMKSEFIKIVSHQLRTPLSSIRWHLEMLIHEELGKLETDEQKKSLDYMYQNTRDLINTLEHLLISMEIEERKIFLHMDSIQIENLIEEVIQDYKRKAEEKEIPIKFERPSQYLPAIVIDTRKIKYVLSILLNNAIRYTEKGGRVGIEVQQTLLSDNRDGLLISVSDTGIGIPKEDISNLFLKFYRGQGAIRFSPGGIGVGLFITKAFIEAHKGRIWVESRLGQGATFNLVIPYGLEADKAGQVIAK